MNYYERHIGDYLKDTAHLSLLEHGVYTRLMDVYYTKETGIPVIDVARLVGARSKDEKQALDAVLKEFFVSDADAYRQARCDREIARYKEKQEKAQRSANARWKPQLQHDERSADAMRTHTERIPNAVQAQCQGNALQSPVTSNQTPVTKMERTARGSRLPPDFAPDFQFAIDGGIQDTAEEANKFRDYWNSQPGQKGVKTDWPATWRNWCRGSKSATRPAAPGKHSGFSNLNYREGVEEDGTFV